MGRATWITLSDFAQPSPAHLRKVLNVLKLKSIYLWVYCHNIYCDQETKCLVLTTNVIFKFSIWQWHSFLLGTATEVSTFSFISWKKSKLEKSRKIYSFCRTYFRTNWTKFITSRHSILKKHSTRYVRNVVCDAFLYMWFVTAYVIVLTVYSRCHMVSTDQADPSCFYLRISWILMERHWFYFFVPPLIAGPQK